MKIAVFASGEGTNAEAIIRRLNAPGSPHSVSLVVTDRPGAGVISRADRHGVPVEIISRKMLADEKLFKTILLKHAVEFIALGGFLAMIPEWLIDAFPERIVNIHPSLLPRHGGKGMYGHRVHEAVIASGDTESGISIHYVDKEYDSGKLIFQASTRVMPGDTANDVEQRVRTLELAHYPEVVASLLDSFPQPVH
ncbi:MAG: phosphoribosylglycinamide formyltransferase [Bacteroides sp.]|nr:phosphoribosylglycinamide formyltransferase [Bacteroides sp.]